MIEIRYSRKRYYYILRTFHILRRIDFEIVPIRFSHFLFSSHIIFHVFVANFTRNMRVVMIKASDRLSAVVCNEVHHVALRARARCARDAHYVHRERDRVAWLETLGIRTAKAITHRHGNGSLLSAAYTRPSQTVCTRQTPYLERDVQLQISRIDV